MQERYSQNPLSAAFWSGSWMLGLAFLFSFFTTMLMLSAPMFMLLIYDRVLSARSQESLVALFALVTFLLVLLALFDYARRRVVARFGARLQDRLELQVQRAAEARTSDGKSGKSVADGTKELDRLRGFFHSAALVSVMDVLWAPIFLGAVFVFHPLLGWVSTIGIILLVAVTGLRSLFSGHLVEGSEKTAKAMNEVARDIRNAQSTITSQRLSGQVIERWRNARRSSRNMSIVVSDRITWFTIASTHLRLFFQVLILALGANLVLQHSLTVGGMVACFILVGRVFVPVDSFLNQLPNLFSARENWKKLRQTLTATSETQPLRSMATARFDGFSVRDARIELHRSGTRDLSAITFSAAQGDVVQITGGTGSGKSTLAEALVGHLPLRSGAIAIGGQNIEQLSAEELGRLVGYLPESIGFFPGTIYENIARMHVDAAEVDVISAARRAGAHQMILRLPNGYQTVLDSVGTGLSRGERARIGLARAVYGRPNVLVLDDVAEVLPPKCGIFTEGGPSVVLITRAPRALMVPSRHYRITKGSLLEQPEIPSLAQNETRPVPSTVRMARG